MSESGFFVSVALTLHGPLIETEHTAAPVVAARGVMVNSSFCSTSTTGSTQRESAVTAWHRRRQTNRTQPANSSSETTRRRAQTGAKRCFTTEIASAGLRRLISEAALCRVDLFSLSILMITSRTFPHRLARSGFVFAFALKHSSVVVHDVEHLQRGQLVQHNTQRKNVSVEIGLRLRRVESGPNTGTRSGRPKCASHFRFLSPHHPGLR